MTDTAISVQGLGKHYIIGHKKQGEFRHALGDKLKGIFKPNASEKEVFWALKDIDFEIKRGEAVGIIGRNGAGKSTLLKILSRITDPSTGRFEINGRVSSLLEVGTGFHPELSGRENIYLNGTILGMKRVEIKQKFDEIVDFSGVEKFLDTPVKHYSSGMKVRLAFSVAAHLEPEILIVDEVLAVGDAEFQKKCLGKMDQVSKNEGRTVIFVSHNMKAVADLCERGIMLQNGEIVANESVAETIRFYQGAIQNSVKTRNEFYGKNISRNDSIVVNSIILKSDNELDYFTTHDDLIVETIFELLLPNTQIDVTIHLEDEQGNFLFMSSTGFKNNLNFPEGKLKAICKIPKNLLHSGIYSISRLLFVKDKATILHELNNPIVFELEEPIEKGVGWKGKKEGLFKPDLEWEIEKIR